MSTFSIFNKNYKPSKKSKKVTSEKAQALKNKFGIK